MHIHYLQHVDFEDLANIETWAKERQHTVSRTLMHKGEQLPVLDSFDWLIIMGGPMNIYEEKEYPWLKLEKHFIQKAIQADKVILGICLGAQLLADVLGGKVTKNRYKEIGWWAVSLTEAGKKHPLFRGFSETFTPLHWHGDTFAIPPKATHLAESPGCVSQAFIQGNAIGLQFHLESSTESVNDLTKFCINEIHDAPYIQKCEDIGQYPSRLTENFRLLELFLDNLEGVSNGTSK